MIGSPLDDQSYRMFGVSEEVLGVQVSQVAGVVRFDFPYDVADSQVTAAGRRDVYLRIKQTYK